jgi:2-oxoglutarate dehydrogenase complex dehydrogenase (E1) component-like enzyme
MLQTPKFLHHHRPATSALMDFTTGTFFNRVIDDSKGSDNTRHLAHDRSGRPFLEPPDKIVRVILCCGQMYYHLSHARRARKISNIVLVRLEQIAPFPHDIVLRVLRQYRNAELVWCQEEPKNQGAWGYLRCAANSCSALKQCRQLRKYHWDCSVSFLTLTGSLLPLQAPASHSTRGREAPRHVCAHEATNAREGDLHWQARVCDHRDCCILDPCTGAGRHHR